MKKVIIAILSLVLLLSLCACGGNDTTPDTSEPAVTTQPTEVTTETTAEPTTEPTECTHEYTESVTVEASCTTEGEKTFTCSVCGDSYTEAIEKTEHAYADATCTAPKTCPGCGATEGEALGHSYKNATCTKPKTCTVCGATSGYALGHSYKDATCTAPKTCTTCGATSGSALGHNYTGEGCTGEKTCTVCGASEKNSHKYTDATCTEPKTCSTCGATEGEALGHSYKEATCTEPKTCTTCGVTEGEALGHSYKEATCTEPKTCSACGATEGEALGHSYKEATCTEPKTCSTCGVTDGDALGHSYDDGVCTVCGEQDPNAEESSKKEITEGRWNWFRVCDNHEEYYCDLLWAKIGFFEYEGDIMVDMLYTGWDAVDSGEDVEIDNYNYCEYNGNIYSYVNGCMISDGGNATINGDTVTVFSYGSETRYMILTRTGDRQFTITEISGSWTGEPKVGDILTYSES